VVGAVLSICAPGVTAATLTRVKVDAPPVQAVAVERTFPVLPPPPPKPRPRSPVPIYHTAKPVHVLRQGRPTHVIRRLNVRQPVVFITIDDGYVTDPRVLGLVRAWGLPVTVFLTEDAGKRGVAFYRGLAAAGARIESHTLTHPFLRGMRYARQRREICGPIRRYERLFGQRGHLFRPPYGSYGPDTLRAASECALGAAVMWTAEMRNGRLTTDPRNLRPGDIILLHFRKELYVELHRLMRILRARGIGGARFGAGSTRRTLRGARRRGRGASARPPCRRRRARGCGALRPSGGPDALLPSLTSVRGYALEQ
jgi:peptidoglycan/xylan/chitin deacetylase (PgdA/CDA1 family)